MESTAYADEEEAAFVPKETTDYETRDFSVQRVDTNHDLGPFLWS
jgi:hypothetical protein